MSEYCERERDCGENERTNAKKYVSDCRTRLSETEMLLARIKEGIDGDPAPDRKTDEPKCLNDELKALCSLSMNCLALAHIIFDDLFSK